jgi:hypothetical protein
VPCDGSQTEFFNSVITLSSSPIEITLCPETSGASLKNLQFHWNTADGSDAGIEFWNSFFQILLPVLKLITPLVAE